MRVWQARTLDRYELIIAQFDYAKDLAKWAGFASIKGLRHNMRNKNKKKTPFGYVYFEKVELDKDESEELFNLIPYLAKNYTHLMQ